MRVSYAVVKWAGFTFRVGKPASGVRGTVSHPSYDSTRSRRTTAMAYPEHPSHYTTACLAPHRNQQPLPTHSSPVSVGSAAMLAASTCPTHGRPRTHTPLSRLTDVDEPLEVLSRPVKLGAELLAVSAPRRDEGRDCQFLRGGGRGSGVRTGGGGGKVNTRDYSWSGTQRRARRVRLSLPLISERAA